MVGGGSGILRTGLGMLLPSGVRRSRWRRRSTARRADFLDDSSTALTAGWSAVSLLRSIAAPMRCEAACSARGGGAHIEATRGKRSTGKRSDGMFATNAPLLLIHLIFNRHQHGHRLLIQLNQHGHNSRQSQQQHPYSEQVLVCAHSFVIARNQGCTHRHEVLTRYTCYGRGHSTYPLRFTLGRSHLEAGRGSSCRLVAF